MGYAREHTQYLLIFHTSGFDCAFPLEAVREIVPMARLSIPPGMPAGLAGFLDLLDLPEQLAGLHTPMIVLRGVLGPIGILVDSVRGIVTVTSAQMLDIPDSRTFQGYATAAIELDGDMIHLLSPAALLSGNEDRMLVDYSTMSQARLMQLSAAPMEETH